MADIGAYKENVKFSDSDAQALITACNNAASAIDGQSGSRKTSRTTGEHQFTGYYSTLFTSNGVTQVSDATELAGALRQVSKLAGELRTAADQEQQRRVKARAWEDKQNHRNALEKVGDGISHLWGGDEPPVPPPASQLHHTAPKPPAGKRETPKSGGGSSSGTSSAIPANLRSFATSTSSDDKTLTTEHSSVQKAYTAFAASCHWGSLDASGVLSGFQQFIGANAEEVAWANTIAAAFEKAGGSGSLRTLSNQALGAALKAAGVSATRSDIMINMPSVLGGVPTSGFANDPVNTATGNFTEPETDLAFGDGCAALVFTRNYNSAADTAGAFGPGWASWSESRLLITPDEASWVLPDGRHIVFPRLDDGWSRATGASYWLTRDKDALLVSDNSGGRWFFTAAGRLESFDRGSGTRVELLYGADGRLAGLVHERGRSVTVEWHEDRIARVVASDGRQIVYGYDDQRRLTEAAGPLGTRRYVWGDSGLIEQVIDGDGVVEALNGYDEQGRVIWQRSPFGRVTRFSYLGGGVTEVADTDGDRANTWIADAQGRLIGVIDSNGNRQSYEWDSHGGMVKATDRAGQQSTREYDERGRLIRQLTPAGADLQYGFDDQDRVVTVVVGSGDGAGADAVTIYEYDGADRNPSVMIDPSGGRTEMVWENGLLAHVTDPTDVVLRFSYDEHGDLVATTNAVGNTARLERDDAGRIVAAVTPSGHRTTYAYDEAGLPVSRLDPDGGVWRFEHSTAGRLVAQVAPDGGRTEIEYDSTGEEVRTIDPLGRAITRALDDLGNLASVHMPDGSTWSYTHDALSRLVETVDPAGGVWANRYDADGALVATSDPAGVTDTAVTDRAANAVTVDDGLLASTVRRDALGRLQSVTSSDDDAQTFVYDACGRVVEILDAEGALTLIRRDAAGRPVEITDPTGVSTRYAYDACGRLIEEIGPDGGITTREYDADSLLVRQTLPTGDTAWAKYDASARLVQVHQPGSGTATYTYDRNGRVTSAVDTWWGTRRLAYDLAGQLIAVTNGLGGVTRYEYDENGRLVRTVDPAGSVTTRVWDGMNRLVSETDALGRTTTAGYDAAGRQTWQEGPDGHRMDFVFDESGREASTSVDGAVVASVTRDLRNRTVTIEDFSGTAPVTHVKQWDRADRLVRHARGAADGQVSELAWVYDAAGRRTEMVDAFGRVTRYGHDRFGRLATVEHPSLGKVELSYDGAGQLVGAAASDPAGRVTEQTWMWTDGMIVGHTVSGTAASGTTEIERDEDSRIVAVVRDGDRTEYAYDLAGQLVGAVGGGATQTWEFDTSGRLVRRSDGASQDAYSYDAAGQLLVVRHADGTSTAHSYDLNGRRTRSVLPDGRARGYEWSPGGWLTRVSETVPGSASGAVELHVDALGQLGQAGAATLWWDTAASVPTLAGVGDSPVLPLGAVTGLGDRWTAPGWRTSRPDGRDPWQISSTLTMPSGLGVTAIGTLTVGAGSGLGTLEWLGKRAYDPTSYSFLSVDPVAPVTGSGWAANPYNYAGNNPLAFSDPTGLHPLTDDELRKQTRGWLADAWDATSKWATTGWGAWVIGGAMVIGGGILMATGVGGPLGAMLVSGGADALIQKATTGTVDYGEVVITGALGGVGDFGIAAKAGLTGVKAVVASGAISGGMMGGTMNGYAYFSGPGPHTVGGALETIGKGTVIGAGTGAASAAVTEVVGGKLNSAITSKVHENDYVPRHADLPRHAAPSSISGSLAAGAVHHTSAAAGAVATDYLNGERDPNVIRKDAIYFGLTDGVSAYSPHHGAHAAH